MFYQRKLEDLESAFHTNLETGLTEQEAKEAQDKYGFNEIEGKKKKPLIVRFLMQFKDTLILILIAAAIISMIVSPKEWIESLIIMIVVIINAILGVAQEANAEKSLQALSKLSAPRAKVIRAGQTVEIPSREVVPGDILVLEAGDKVASDSRIIEAVNLKVDESALTGESLPVEKEEMTLDREVPLGDRKNMVFSSCNVTYGRGKALVVSTGERNEVGKIASMLSQAKSENTPLQDKLNQMGKTIGMICVTICVVVFGLQLLNGLTVIDSFKTAVALAVAAIPEGLATVVTIVLAMSVTKMVKRNAIIKRLPAVETLGSTSVVCSDKTGTLTQNKMTVVKACKEDGKVLPLDQWGDEINQVLNLFTVCSDGKISMVDGEEVSIGDPTETALVKASMNKGFTRENLDEEYKRIGELPFDSDRKMMTVFVEKDNQIVSITKGGPDVVFARCAGADLEAISKANEQMSLDALRVLAVGIRHWDKMPDELDSQQVENQLTFMGLVGMIDPPREEAKAAVAEAKKAGIRTVMITGDHVVTAGEIAKQLGILEEGQKAMSGEELSAIKDEDLAEHVEEYSVYARVAPEDKVRIVNAWQGKGKVVAMTGDGVNDAPALKKADIGCAMGITGTEVAKEAASMILTDDNFATIIDSVEQGRGIYDNIKKDVQFLLAGNIGEVIIIFFASLISLLFDSGFGIPLLPIHLLWVNLITDSIPAFALGLEPIDKEVMNRMPRPKEENFFANGLGTSIAWQGVMIGALSLISYAIGNNVSHETGMTMALFTLCGCQLIHSFNVKSRNSILNKKLFNNPYLWGSFGISVFFQVILLIVPALRELFHLQLLDLNHWLIVIGMSLMALVICEVVKLILHGKDRKVY